MKPIKTFLCIGAVTAGLAACSSTPKTDMMAQSRMEPSQSRMDPSMPAVSAGELQAFTRAARQVSAIDQSEQAQAQTASAVSQPMLEREANGEKARAVNAEGLTVPQFNSIAMAVERDPTLNRQYSDMMNSGNSVSLR